MKQFIISIFAILLMVNIVWANNELAQHLQDISVTIKSPNQFGGESQGSGVIITRVLKKNDKDVKVNFVWTAGHVVDNLRSVRTVIDAKTGIDRKLVEFRPAYIVKELVENGRRVGELNMEARVVKYSDADDGHDLALLMILKQDFVDASTKFYLDENTPPIGTQLFHVGSLLGQKGANSMTAGIISQVGRVIQLGSSNSVIFDQTTVTAFPGSSGGGVFLANDGRYVGMLVRGAGETFNLIVPIRRFKEWAIESKIEWAINPDVPAPSLEEIEKLPVESSGRKWGNSRIEPEPDPNSELNFLIRIN